MTNLGKDRTNRIAKVALLLLGMSYCYGAWASIIPAKKPEPKHCVALGSWVIPGVGETTQREVIVQASKASVVLLGETHVNADHHRWQLQTLAALHAMRPNMVIGFEMFPRRVQAVLDKWVAGELSESEFLRASEWNFVWNTDANLYLPLFHFARMNRIRKSAASGKAFKIL